MILDNLKNQKRYKSLGQGFESAFNYIKKTDIAALDIGRYEIFGDDVYMMVQEYTTLDEKERSMEAHHVYADIQIVIRGEETIYFAPDTRKMIIDKPYSDEKDVVLFKDGAIETACSMKEGDFTIFFPNEPHKPGCCLDGECEVKKAVIKVRV